MQPATLLEAIKYFADPDTCLRFVADLRWPEGITCPRCQAKEPCFIKTRRLWECKGCRKQFSVKVGTIFEDSAIKLDKWLCAIWLIVNAKNGVSSYEIHRSLGVTQKSAWFMMHRIRLALQRKSLDKLKREVEVDETYIGGKARFMHAEKKKDALLGKRGGTSGKAIVLGMLERKGNVHLRIVKNTTHEDLQPVIRKNVERGSEVFTDQWGSYEGLNAGYLHHVINHAEAYAKGRIHTQGIENFWSLLKRGLTGTYISVEPFHLFRYLDEQAFRFNSRKRTDLERFIGAFTGIVGRRVTYPQLIGATAH
jgi:transposase-like protein